MSNLKTKIFLDREIQQGLRLFKITGKGFFHQNMNPFFQALFPCFKVINGGYRDAHRIRLDRHRFQTFEPRNPKFLPDFLSPFQVVVDHSQQVRVLKF